jgi:hypothetical protein
MSMTKTKKKSKAQFQKQLKDISWEHLFYRLCYEGWRWQEAAYIAWSTQPKRNRQPDTLKELAAWLGYTTPNTISKWNQRKPEIKECIYKLVSEMLVPHRVDVFQALIEVARTPDPKAHSDRKLFLELTQDYIPKSKQEREHTIKGVKGYIGISPDDWDQDDE